MTLHLNNHHPKARISRSYLENKFKRLLRFLKQTHATVSITFVSDREIQKLNTLYRKKNKPTDVLSFPMENDFLGDVIISIDTAKRQATEKKHSLRQECLILGIHGILHLLGYDHVRNSDWKIMQKVEEAALKHLK